MTGKAKLEPQVRLKHASFNHKKPGEPVHGLFYPGRVIKLLYIQCKRLKIN